MIKLVNHKQIDNTTNYKFFATRCNSCNKTENVNIIDVRQDSGNSGAIIALCNDCLKDLKKQINEKIGERKMKEPKLRSLEEILNKIEEYESNIKFLDERSDEQELKKELTQELIVLKWCVGLVERI